MAFLDDYLLRVEAISGKVKGNALISETRQAMQEFLKDYAVSDEKKGEIYASFEATIAANTINKVFDIALMIDTEELKQKDIKAGIVLKNQQAIAAWESCLYEYTRRKVLIRSEASNSGIQKSKSANDFLNSISNRVDPTQDDISYVKKQIDAIDTSTMVDLAVAEVGNKPTAIEV